MVDVSVTISSMSINAYFTPVNAPHGAADAHYVTWKNDHGDDPKEVEAQMQAARAIDQDCALDGVTANQLHLQALNISKQITQLVCYVCYSVPFWFSFRIAEQDIL